MKVTVISFGFKHGHPPESDVQFDVRFLPNPYYVPELKETTGLMPKTASYVVDSEAAGEFFNHLKPLLTFLVSQYAASGRDAVAIAIGCTGGRHRSVAVTEKLQQLLSDEMSLAVKILHRDIDRT